LTGVDDIRWFAPNRYCTLPVPRLREAGLRIATEGNEPAGLVFISDATCLREGFRQARRNRCPLVLNIWDVQPWRLEGGQSDFVFEVNGRLAVLPRPAGGYPGRRRYYSRLGYVARRATTVWAPSLHSQSEIQRWFGVTVEHVPFCFDSDRFNRAIERCPAPGVPVLLSVSRLVEHKNHAAVVRAATLLSPRPRVRIIGNGPEAGPLRLLADTLGVALQLDEGWCSEQAIVDAYLTASVLVCPSRFEGIGLTPIEGAAVGIPTIASDIPTHREFAAPGVTLVPLDHDYVMAAAIAAALESGASASPGPKHPLPELTIEACAARFLPRLEDLLRSR
jgi:glycosyltransferase involved in cell wall biosynthesis